MSELPGYSTRTFSSGEGSTILTGCKKSLAGHKNMVPLCKRASVKRTSPTSTTNEPPRRVRRLSDGNMTLEEAIHLVAKNKVPDAVVPE